LLPFLVVVQTPNLVLLLIIVRVIPRIVATLGLVICSVITLTPT
jgi:hypothetical protein